MYLIGSESFVYGVKEKAYFIGASAYYKFDAFTVAADVISEKMEWSFRNSGMLFRNKRNEESFWSKARPFKSYSEASFC